MTRAVAVAYFRTSRIAGEMEDRIRALRDEFVRAIPLPSPQHGQR